MWVRFALCALAATGLARGELATARTGWDTIYTTFEDAVPEDLLARAAAEVSIIKDYATNRMHKNDKATTFYRPFGGGKPRFAIEALVDFIGHGLYARWPEGDFAPGPFRRPKAAIAGLEWWVQSRRPNEEIGYHYDKDESLANMNKMVPPAVSSVFYLNGCRSSPTQILNQTTIAGNDDAPRSPVQGVLSYPARNKYILFDGQLMHGVPPALRDPACTEHRDTILINFWPADAPPQPPNCIRLPTKTIKREMPALLDKAGAKALLKAAKRALEADTAQARAGDGPTRAGAAATPEENARFAVLRMRDSAADALVPVGGAAGAGQPEVEHRIVFPPNSPFRFSLPPSVHARGDVVRIAWASDKALSGMSVLTDASAGFLAYLQQHTTDPKLVVIVPPGRWPAFEARVMAAARNFVERTRATYLDLGNGAQIARDEFGVTEGPTVVVVRTHSGDGERLASPEVLRMDRWRRRALKRAKREAKRSGGKVPLRVRRLADSDPSPKRFAKQIEAFLAEVIPTAASPPHGPMVSGVPLPPPTAASAGPHDEL